MTALLIGSRKDLGPEEKILSAINLGGESGVMGALTGALAGAGEGDDIVIPEDWLSRLANRRQIQIRAENLLSGSVQAGTHEFQQMEYDMTKSVSLDLDRLLKKHPEGSRAPARDLREELIIKPLIPDRKNKRQWREFERKKARRKEEGGIIGSA